MRCLWSRDLRAGDGAVLAAFLKGQPTEYRRDFHPFPDEGAEALEKLLNEKRKDRFQGVFFGSEMVAYYQLRGWDEGFDRPSFGVIVDQRHRGRGLGAFCLSAALAECRLRGAASCMLKVAPSNLGAAALYRRHGFAKESVCPRTGHEILSIRF